MKLQTFKIPAVLFFCILSTLVLFAGFFKNFWRVAGQEWFSNFELDTESLILGRMVESRQAGIFSMGGLPGSGSLSDVPLLQYTNDPSFQYLSYYNGTKFESFLPYESQIGGQGMFFSLLDKIMPLPYRLKLGSFHAFTALLSTIALTVIILWFYLEFGSSVGLTLFISTVFSPWLVVFGKNLWFSLWAFFLPMIVMMYFLRKFKLSTNRQLLLFGLLVFLGILAKCIFNGYEYITTTLIMTVVPFIFYSISNRVSFRKFLIGSLTAAFSSLMAILMSFIILCIQIASVEGSFQKGIDHILFSLEKRSYADVNYLPAEYAASLNANPVEVVSTYLNGTFMDFNNYLPTLNSNLSRNFFRIRYWYLIILFGIMSALVILTKSRKRLTDEERRRKNALVAATWFSILAPLSWFIIFKAHSYIHTQMNFVVWQMPFTLFGFAVCGLFVKTLISNFMRPPQQPASAMK
jgi:hypothetical protein